MLTIVEKIYLLTHHIISKFTLMKINRGVFMKKILVIISLGLLITACSNADNNTVEQNQPASDASNDTSTISENTKDTNNRTPEEIINAFKDAGLPIGEVIIHDSKSDPNNLLGRPDGYIASAHFEDKTVDQIEPLSDDDENLPLGGSIEIWPSQEGAQKRLDYMLKIDEVMNLQPLKQYRYLNDNILLRLEYEILPEDAEKYEEVLNTF